MCGVRARVSQARVTKQTEEVCALHTRVSEEWVYVHSRRCLLLCKEATTRKKTVLPRDDDVSSFSHACYSFLARNLSLPFTFLFPSLLSAERAEEKIPTKQRKKDDWRVQKLQQYGDERRFFLLRISFFFKIHSET